jgi:hypothetical protein
MAVPRVEQALIVPDQLGVKILERACEAVTVKPDKEVAGHAQVDG